MKSVRNIVILALAVLVGILFFAPHTFMKKTPIGAVYKVYRLDTARCPCGFPTGEYNGVAMVIEPLGNRFDSIILEGHGNGKTSVNFDASKIGTEYKVVSAYADKKMYTSTDWTVNANK